jgi:hypothetical protein
MWAFFVCPFLKEMLRFIVLMSEKNQTVRGRCLAI